MKWAGARRDERESISFSRLKLNRLREVVSTWGGDSTGSSHPMGVKIVIAFLSFTVAVDAAYFALLVVAGQVQGMVTLYLHPVFSGLLALAIIGLWKMAHRGLWLAMVMSAIGVITGCYGVVNLMNQIGFIIRQPVFRMQINLFFFAFFGPVLLVSSSLIIVYLYKRRRVFLEHVLSSHAST